MGYTTMLEDAELLRRYAEEKSEAAFAELVRRHVNLVYAVAHRQVGGDAHLAQDVAQIVFTALARKARALSERPVLAGWLHRSAQFTAIDVVRVERRRRMREQEAHAMPDQLASAENSPPDWDQLRPLLDRAIAELGEQDRDAVVLRFFSGQSFADIGASLRLTENAARMRVERALDKLHAALGRHGVTSTSAALAIALASPAVAAPAGLATSLTGAALAAASAGGAGVAAGGLVSMTINKTVAAVAGSMALLAGGVAYVQTDRLHEMEGSRIAAEQQREALSSDLAKMNERLRQAEQRTADVEKDNGELLRAVEAARAQQAAKQAEARVETQPAASADEQERLAQERSYSQDLARRRATTARQLAEFEEAARAQDRERGYQLLLDATARMVSAGDFQAAVKLYNKAMELKPTGLEPTEGVKELQQTLRQQTVPVDVTLISDERTYVSIAGFQAPARFGTKTTRIPPGDYQVTGRRAGYRDVTMIVQIRAGAIQAPIAVACVTPAQ